MGFSSRIFSVDLSISLLENRILQYQLGRKTIVLPSRENLNSY